MASSNFNLHKILHKYLSPNQLLPQEIDYELLIRGYINLEEASNDSKLGCLRKIILKEISDNVVFPVETGMSLNPNSEMNTCEASYEEIAELLNRRDAKVTQALLPRVIHLYFRIFRISIRDSKGVERKSKALERILDLVYKYFPKITEEIQEESLSEHFQELKNPTNHKNQILGNASASNQDKTQIGHSSGQEENLDNVTNLFGTISLSQKKTSSPKVSTNKELSFSELCQNFVRSAQIEFSKLKSNNPNEIENFNQAMGCLNRISNPEISSNTQINSNNSLTALDMASNIIKDIQRRQSILEQTQIPKRIQFDNSNSNSNNPGNNLNVDSSSDSDSDKIQQNSVRPTEISNRPISNSNQASININLDDRQQNVPQVLRIDLSNSSFASRLNSWNLRYHGKKESRSVKQFLKCLHHAKDSLNGTDEDLFKCWGQFLMGEARDFVFLNIDNLLNWEMIESALIRQYTPPANDKILEEKIRNRTQLRFETFSEFLLQMERLFSQLTIQKSDNEKFKIVYDNMRDSYKHALALKDNVNSLSSLSMYCGKLDEVYFNSKNYKDKILQSNDKSNSNQNSKNTANFRNFTQPNNNFSNQNHHSQNYSPALSNLSPVNPNFGLNPNSQYYHPNDNNNQINSNIYNQNTNRQFNNNPRFNNYNSQINKNGNFNNSYNNNKKFSSFQNNSNSRTFYNKNTQQNSNFNNNQNNQEKNNSKN